MWTSVPLNFIAWNENPQHAQLCGSPPKDIKNLEEVKTTMYTEMKALQIGIPKIKNHSWNINPNTWTCIQSPNKCLLFNISLQSYSHWKAASNSQWHLAKDIFRELKLIFHSYQCKDLLPGSIQWYQGQRIWRQPLLQGWTSAIQSLQLPINVSHFTP